MSTLLEVEDLTVTYDAVVGVRGLSVSLPAGRTLAVLGANGAGKTSLLRAITGLEPVTTGDVRIDGASVVGERPERIARRGVAHVPDHRGLFASLTVAENLRMALYGADREATPGGRDALDGVHEQFPILEERADQVAGNLSGGQQQMLAIARALVQEPRLLLLDEMSMGLAPSIVEELFEIVGTLAHRGIAVVLVEQFVAGALKVADEVVVLEQGKALVRGTPGELATDDLAAAYLGGEDALDLGMLPPPPDFVRSRVAADVDARRMRELERIAADRGVAVGALVADAVHELLDREGTP